MDYKDNSITSHTVFQRFYNNTKLDRKINEKSNESSESTKDKSLYNNPFDDINAITSILSNQDGSEEKNVKDSLPFISSLSETIKSKIEEVSSIIVETKFIPFLIRMIADDSAELEAIKVDIVELAHSLIDNYKSLHIIFYDEHFLPIVSNFIKNSDNPRLLAYSIFSIIHLYNSFGNANSSDFAQCVSVSMFCNAYQKIENVKKKKMRRYADKFLRGSSILITKYYALHQLNIDDSNAALYLIHSILFKNKLTDACEFALKALSLLIENSDIDFEQLSLSIIPKFIDENINKLSSEEIFPYQVFSCDVLVALFNKGYFENRHFDVPIDRILDNIEYSKTKDKGSAFIRLLAAIIKCDTDGKYIEQLYFPKNHFGILSIYDSLIKGNFGTMEASAYCLIEVINKLDGELLAISLDKCIIESLVKIINIGRDFEDCELILVALSLIDKVFAFSISIHEFDKVSRIFQSCDGPELMLELDEYDKDICVLSQRIHKLFDDNPGVFLF